MPPTLAPFLPRRRRPAQPSGFLATALGAAARFLAVGLIGATVFVLHPWGLGWGTVAVVAALLVGVLVGTGQGPVRGRLGWLRAWAHRLVIVALIGWLALLFWARLSPGGSVPASKSDPDAIRVVSWNLHRGQDRGPPWLRCGWPEHRRPLLTALRHAAPEILCVQEALPDQVAFLEAALSGHRRAGVGRDDGRDGGEHCAIFFDAARFTRLGGGTFWLEEPADEPPGPTRLGPKRICTWVRLRDRRLGRTFRVYNTHLYLTASMRQAAARLILSRIAAGDPTDPVLLAGDFNAPPGSPRAGSSPRPASAPPPTMPPRPTSFTASAWSASTTSWSARAGGSSPTRPSTRSPAPPSRPTTSASLPTSPGAPLPGRMSPRRRSGSCPFVLLLP